MKLNLVCLFLLHYFPDELLGFDFVVEAGRVYLSMDTIG
jgi:hypothetical protein